MVRIKCFDIKRVERIDYVLGAFGNYNLYFVLFDQKNQSGTVEP